MNAETENLVAGTYALLLETNGCRAISYVVIDDQFKTKLEDIPQEQVDKLFLRSENMEVTEEIVIGTVELASAKIDFVPDNWALLIEKKYTSYSNYEEANTSSISALSTSLNISAVINKGDFANSYIEYLQCKNISKSDLEKLQIGDSLRIKMKTNEIKKWGLAFVCTDNGVETTYKCPFNKFAELRNENGTDYYFVEGKYDELWDTTWDFKAKKPFKAKDVSDMYFYANVSTSSTKMEILEIEITDSSTIPTKLVKTTPFFLTNGQVVITTSDYQPCFGVKLTVLDSQPLSYEIIGATNRLENSLKLSFPIEYTEPYFGLGYGYSEGSYIPLYFGIKLLKIIDLRCSLNIYNNERRPVFSLGIPLWINSQKITRVPKEETIYSDNKINKTVTNKQTTVNKDNETITYNDDKTGWFTTSSDILTFGGTGDIVWTKCDWDTTSIKNIIIEEGITSLSYSNKDAGIFSNLLSLNTVTLPNTLTSLSNSIFSDCSSLKKITIPSSVTTIEKRAFNGWSSDQTINLDWASTDTTARNLDGLSGTKAKIYYSDGIKYN